MLALGCRQQAHLQLLQAQEVLDHSGQLYRLFMMQQLRVEVGLQVGQQVRAETA
jgi:hypothetical protein